jgi:branched-chain amino acid transport system permease protein
MTQPALAPGKIPAREAKAKGQFMAAPLPECIVLIAGLAAYLALPSDLGLLTNIAANALLALSLSLVLGQAGIGSMGHAALYGAGAYAAGLLALHVNNDPLIGLIGGGLVGLLVALVSGAVLLRSHGLTLVMLTIAAAQLLLELANWARNITGGDDGLTGYTIAPLLGVFEFDFLGRTGYFYSLAVLVFCFFLLRRLVASPFGLTARAIKLDSGRVEALGGKVYPHLLAVYSVGGFFAGIAGALTAQTAKVASLSMLDFSVSSGALIMVVLGGTSRLSGALLGTVAYMLLHHVASNLSPHNWLLVIGLILIGTIAFLPGGLIEVVDRCAAKWSSRDKEVQ